MQDNDESRGAPHDDDAQGKSWLDRLLGIVTEVRAGEATTALLLALNVFLLLCAYYVIKPVREGLIISGSGAEVKIYTSAGQAALLAFVVPAYGYLAGRLKRHVLIRVVTLFFVACLALFYFLVRWDIEFIGIAFYLWVGIFNLMIVAQFWSFAADIYTQSEGERLFPVAAFGASLGAVAGSQLTDQLVKPIGLDQMLLVGAGVLLASLGVTGVIEVREKERIRQAQPGQKGDSAPDSNSEDDSKADEEGQKTSKSQAFKLVWRNRYLLLIALLMMLTNLVNTTGEYILAKIVETEATEIVNAGQAGGMSEKDWIGKFYADFFFYVNIATLVLQTFLVSRIIRYIGIRYSVLVLPVIALGSYVTIALVPVLAVVRWFKTAENSIDYSLNNTVRNALFLPVTKQEKYQAKQAIDTFFVRGGDTGAAVLVFVGSQLITLPPQGFAWINVCFGAVWLVVAFLIGKRYAERRTSAPAEGRTSDEHEAAG